MSNFLYAGSNSGVGIDYARMFGRRGLGLPEDGEWSAHVEEHTGKMIVFDGAE